VVDDYDAATLTGKILEKYGVFMQDDKEKIKILFLCTGNSCRSQMAEGWARHLKGNIIDAYSSGICPIGVSSRAIQVMAEAGVDISIQKSQHLDEFSEIDFDYVITLCDNAAENCPVFTGKAKMFHRPFEDPYFATGSEEDILETFRMVRDDIRKYIDRMPDNLKNSEKREIET
jgi:arsenate reductase